MNIVLKNVCKSFEDKTVLNNFSYTFQEGKRYCVMGPSGIGKTTLLRLLLGQISPDSGEIQGVPKKLSAVFQEDRLAESFSALGNLIAVTGKSVPREESASLLGELGLSKAENSPVSQFSGGMKRRVAIARGLIAKADLLVMDEPFKGLDEALKLQTIKTVLERSKGKTVVFSTHDPSEAELMGAEIINI